MVNLDEHLQFLIEEVGTVYPTTPLTDEQSAIVKAARGMWYVRPRRCFHNAQRLVAGDKSGRLVYVEGYLDGWIAHGWAAIDGIAVDITLPDDPSERAGLPFARDAVVARSRARTACFLDDWEQRWRMLTDAHTRATVLHESVRPKLEGVPVWQLSTARANRANRSTRARRSD